MTRPFGLFERFGVELEYMIVDARTQRVLPRADRLIKRVSGHVNGDVSRGALAWSNELALHVIEFKTDQPARQLNGLGERFQSEVQFVNSLLAAEGAMLLPTAMHPWMNPHRESRLWPHDCGEIYAAFHRIFNCRGHGWTNLQSTHLNLPFANDDEFGRLHTAIRLVLPLLPALAASSPFVDGRRAPLLDMRLDAYRKNCARIPSITAAVVPEPIQTPGEYQKKILGRIYRDLAPHDPEGILQNEWANARGAIARFERNTIEVRVLDIQECPAADLAIIQFLVAVLQRLANESLAPWPLQIKPTTPSLANLLQRTAREGGQAPVTSTALLKALGAPARSGWTVQKIWQYLYEVVAPAQASWRPWIDLILQEGNLSQRILKSSGPRPTRDQLRAVYRHLGACLDLGIPFQPISTAGSAKSKRPLHPLFSCEHATNVIPRRYGSVARQAGRALKTHRGYDPGAADLAASLSRAFKTPLLKGGCSRLLVELNRSLGHPKLWSEFSRDLPLAEKSEVLADFYLPYRRRIKERILSDLQLGHSVLHLGIHTFTPVLNGQVREVDIGLLFDPRRAAEKRFCERWRALLNLAAPHLRVRFNQPYRGVSDGLIPALRGEYPGRLYLGVELEVNQRFPLERRQEWQRLKSILSQTLRQGLMD